MLRIQLEPTGYLVPVNHIPDRRQIVGAAVLVFEVVGVLPHVNAQEGGVAFHQGRVLVGGAVDVQFAVFVLDQPAPARAKAGQAGLGHLGFEFLEGAKGGVDGLGQLAGGLLGAAGGQDVPEQGVVVVAPAVVAYGGADVLGHLGNFGEQVFDAPVMEFGVFSRAALRLFT